MAFLDEKEEKVLGLFFNLHRPMLDKELGNNANTQDSQNLLIFSGSIR